MQGRPYFARARPPAKSSGERRKNAQSTRGRHRARNILIILITCGSGTKPAGELAAAEAHGALLQELARGLQMQRELLPLCCKL